MSASGSTQLLTTHSHCSCSWFSKKAAETCKGLQCTCPTHGSPVAKCCTKLPTIILNPHYRKGAIPSLATVDCHAGTKWYPGRYVNLEGVDDWVTTGRFTRNEMEAFKEQYEKNPKIALVTAAKYLASRLSTSLLRSGDPIPWRVAILTDDNLGNDAKEPLFHMMGRMGMDVHTFKGSELIECSNEDTESMNTHWDGLTLYDDDKAVSLCSTHGDSEGYKIKKPMTATEDIGPGLENGTAVADGKKRSRGWISSLCCGTTQDA